MKDLILIGDYSNTKEKKDLLLDLVNFFKENGKELLRQIMSKEYNIDINRLKYQNELPDKEDGKFKYDVIVLPTGDTDIGAQRNDVHKTFLLVH